VAAAAAADVAPAEAALGSPPTGVLMLYMPHNLVGFRTTHTVGDLARFFVLTFMQQATLSDSVFCFWCRNDGSSAILAGAGGKGEEEALIRQAHLVQQARDSGGSADNPAKKRRKGGKAAGGESPPPAGSPERPNGGQVLWFVDRLNSFDIQPWSPKIRVCNFRSLAS
jgi:hypothetical protein